MTLHSLQLGRGAARPEYVYVASSWRNPMQTAVCAALRSVGIEHYDFKNPPNGTGFAWDQVKDPGTITVPALTIHGDRIEVKTWVRSKGSDWEPVGEYLDMIQHPRAVDGYVADFSAMERADTFIMVLPCGKSAHLELGWATGAGKRTAILMEDPIEPELMYRGVDLLTDNLFDLLGWLGVED